MEYKNKKPFFNKPLKITIDNPIKDTYYLVKNVVYKEMQILALKKEQDEKIIVIVEAKIMDGQLKYISMVPDEFLGDISGILAGSL